MDWYYKRKFKADSVIFRIHIGKRLQMSIPGKLRVPT